jgi:hypothetical protein
MQLPMDVDASPAPNGIWANVTEPLVADHGRVAFAERRDQPYPVADQMQNRVVGDGGRGVGTRVTTLVGRYGVEASLGERPQPMAPRIQLSGKPWSSSTSGPSPASALRVGAPLTSTTRCRMPMVAPELNARSGGEAAAGLTAAGSLLIAICSAFSLMAGGAGSFED